MPRPDPFDAWLPEVIDRHTRGLSTPEFLKAVRALSARYVERRSELARRSATDSAGKRAAFAGFYAPLHFLTTLEIVRSLGTAEQDPGMVVDLGCGTGTAAAAWACACVCPPAILGVDRQRWALDEARRTWRAFGLSGRPRQGDLVHAAVDLASTPRGAPRRHSTKATRAIASPAGVVLGWSANELDDEGRRRLMPALLALRESGASVLVIEPLAHGAARWWDAWTATWTRAGGRADEWKIDIDLPAALARISEAVGFRRQVIGARSLWLPRRQSVRVTTA